MMEGILARLLAWLLACYRARIVTVEVVIVLYMIGYWVYLNLAEQYYYHKFGSAILRNTSFQFPNGSFCVSSELIDNSTGDNNSYKTVEAQSNHLISYGRVAYTVISALVTIIVGSVSDKYGRKIGMVFPTVGAILQGMLSTIIMNYDLNPYYFIAANVMYGIAGSETCLLASCFAYIADISTMRWRTLRVGIGEACLSLGGCVGTLLAGYWLHKMSCAFVPPMCFYVAINFFLLLYILIAFPESLSRNERAKMREKNPRGLRSLLQGIKLYFGGLSLRSTWMLYVATICLFIVGINISGTILVNVYFLKALPFDFSPFQIGIYEALRPGSQGLANVVIMAVLVFLDVGDAWILLLAVVVHITTSVLLGFVTLTWQLYTISAVKGIEGLVWGAGRGMMSKLVRPEQQGALFSIIAAIQSVMTLLASTIWPVIFPLTLQHNMRSGMTFIFMAAAASLLLPLIISLLLLKKKQERDLETNPLLKNKADEKARTYTINS